MKSLLHISLSLLLFLTVRNGYAQQEAHQISFEFYNHTFNLPFDASIMVSRPFELNAAKIKNCYQQVNEGNYHPILDSLHAFRKKNQLNDWLYYQLVRKTAEQLCPKKEDYVSYTFYKWFLMAKSGFDTRLTIADGRMILYVYNTEDISDIPFLLFENKKYMCLNIHDYPYANLNKVPPNDMIAIPEARGSFSYRVTRMPDFKPEDYSEKKLAFNYRKKAYHFNLKQNQDVQNLFKNYPGVDFAVYFNIPLNKETYSSLIPALKENVSKLKQKNGIDYLMRFTRYAFLYEDDEVNYGKEKRLSPEGTLFATYSDCDDRAALFFYLVKEIYNLPMIAMLYPTHVTIAVQFDKPVGQPIVYNGHIYSVCEPTPQKKNLVIGEIAAEFKNKKYEVVYAYQP